MKVQVLPVSKEEWAVLAADAHKIVFGEVLPEGQAKIDFTLLPIDVEKDEPLGYVTVREIDRKTAYLSFGGAFPSGKGTIKTWLAYSACHQKLKELKYSEALTFIKNNNRAMLKFAAKIGYLITGVRVSEGNVLLEHTLRLSDAF